MSVLRKQEAIIHQADPKHGDPCFLYKHCTGPKKQTKQQKGERGSGREMFPNIKLIHAPARQREGKKQDITPKAETFLFVSLLTRVYLLVITFSTNLHYTINEKDCLD